MRRLALVTLALTLTLSGAGAVTERADALHGGCVVTPAVTETCHLTAPAKTLIETRTWAPATTAMPPGGATWETSVDVLERTRRAARIMAPLRFTLGGAIAIGAGVAYEKAFKMEIPGQGFVYGLITGDEYAGSQAGIDPCWQWTTSGFLAGTGSTPERFMLVKDCGFVNPAYCGTGGHGGVNVNFSTLARAATGTAELSTLTDSSWGCGASNTYQRTRTEAQMEGAVVTRPLTSTEYGDFPGPKVDVGEWTPPTIEPEDWEAAETELGLDTGTFTLPQQTLLDLLAGEIDPDWLPDEFGETVLELPEPLLTETYGEYIGRLQLGGWTGTATITVLDEADALEGCGPGCVVRLRIPLESGETTTYQRPWPSPLPEVPRGTSIRFIVNPPTVPPVIPGDPDEDCPCPVDSIVLPDVELPCEAFPFGAFCWLEQVAEDLDVEPAAPAWTFDLPTVGPADFQANLPTIALDFNDEERLGWFHDFVNVFKTALSWLLWTGAIVVTAAKLLGWRRGDTDPDMPDDPMGA